LIYSKYSLPTALDPRIAKKVVVLENHPTLKKFLIRKALTIPLLIRHLIKTKHYFIITIKTSA
jgi:hypothetical protein